MPPATNKNGSTSTPTLTKFVDFLKIVLYELQPIRYSDAVQLVLHGRSLMWTVGGAVINLAHDISTNVVAIVAEVSLATALFLLLWCTACYLCVIYGGYDMLKLYIMMSLFAGIFATLGTKKAGEISAYSVFNKNQRGILGGLTAEQFDNEIRHRGGGLDNGEEEEGDVRDMDEILIMEDNGHGNLAHLRATGQDGGAGGQNGKKKKKRS